MAENEGDRFALFDAARHSAIYHAVSVEGASVEDVVKTGGPTEQLLEDWRAFALAALNGSGDAMTAALAADVLLLEWRLRIGRAHGPLVHPASLAKPQQQAEVPPAPAAPAPVPAVTVAQTPVAAPQVPAPVVEVPVAAPPAPGLLPSLDDALAQAAGLKPAPGDGQ